MPCDEARIEVAERSAVIVDLRDADCARLELLNDALDPLFAEIPDEVELFDRGLSKGDVPRLWVDVVAHVEMGRDKRQYRFVQDTRYGRAVLAKSYEVPALVGGDHTLRGASNGRARARFGRRCRNTGSAVSPTAHKASSPLARRSYIYLWNSRGRCSVVRACHA